MPLIIKSGKAPKIISKKDMHNKIVKDKEAAAKDELSHLPEEIAERRREILDAKRHREFMARIQSNSEKGMEKLREAELEVTNELVVEAGPDPIIIAPSDVVKVSIEEEKTEVPEFETMTKKELDEWAESVLGLSLDRRKKKADLIETIKKNL